MFHEATTLEFKKEAALPATEGVRIAGPLDERAIVSVVQLGFDCDPFVRWMYSDPASYLAGFSELARAVAVRSIRERSALVAQRSAGAALWFRSGISLARNEVFEIVRSTIPIDLQTPVLRIIDQMASFRPSEPHWYLPIMAVDPSRQGSGIATSLMRFATEVCDEEDLSIYLESSSPRSISLYRRFDFEIIGTIRSGGSPPLFPMLRKRRSDRSRASRDIYDPFIHETADMNGKEN